MALHRLLEVEAAREVEQQGSGLGDVDVVHHRAVPDRHVDLLGDLGAVGADDEVADEVPGPVIGGDVELTGDRVDLGVGGEGALEGAAEVDALHRLELVAEQDRLAAGFDDGEGHARMADDVGVRGAFGVVEARAGRDRLAERLGHAVRHDVAVAVPVGLAVAEAHAVDHAGAGEPVRLGVAAVDRVGAVAQEASVELGGDGAGDEEFGLGDLFGDGGVVAGEVRVDRGHGDDLATVKEPLSSSLGMIWLLRDDLARRGGPAGQRRIGWSLR